MMRWWKGRDKQEEELEAKVRYAAELHGVKPKEVVDTVLDEHDEELEEYEERHKSRVGFWVTLACVGAIFGLGVVFLMKLANMADESGPVANAGMQALQKSIAPTPADNPTLTGTHIVFTYPAVFDDVQHPANWVNTSERYALSSKSDYRKSVQVYVEDAGAMQTDSGYMYRNQDKADYQSEGVNMIGGQAVVFIKSDNSERTLYWQHGGSLVIISVLAEPNVLAGYLGVITSSLRWLP